MKYLIALVLLIALSGCSVIDKAKQVGCNFCENSKEPLDIRPPNDLQMLNGKNADESHICLVREDMIIFLDYTRELEYHLDVEVE